MDSVPATVHDKCMYVCMGMWVYTSTDVLLAPCIASQPLYTISVCMHASYICMNACGYVAIYVCDVLLVPCIASQPLYTTSVCMHA